MNYISEINEFYDWLETNQIPKSAIALWHALMHINNKARWVTVFPVAISTIESKTGFKRSELFEARNILQQKGRIRWKPRGGNLSAEYEIICFSVHIADTKAYAKAYTNPDIIPTQTDTIYKQDNTKQDLFVIIEKEQKSFEHLQDLFEADVGLKMNYAQKGLPAGEFPEAVKQWMIQNHGSAYHDLEKARKHFLFWMPKYQTLKEQTNEPRTQTNSKRSPKERKTDMDYASGL